MDLTLACCREVSYRKEKEKEEHGFNVSMLQRGIIH